MDKDEIAITAGDYPENEMRKNFTPSERVAILETIERKGRRNPTFRRHRGHGLDASQRSVATTRGYVHGWPCDLAGPYRLLSPSRWQLRPHRARHKPDRF